MKAFHKEFLRGLIIRAQSTGTLADAAYAADYMARHSGCAYDDCMNALRKFGLRYADRSCKDRRGMYTAKNPGKDMLRVKFDRETISVTPILSEVPADLLAII